jgi:hypothetical protein
MPEAYAAEWARLSGNRPDTPRLDFYSSSPEEHFKKSLDAKVFDDKIIKDG